MPDDLGDIENSINSRLPQYVQVPSAYSRPLAYTKHTAQSYYTQTTRQPRSEDPAFGCCLYSSFLVIAAFVAGLIVAALLLKTLF